MPVLSAMRFAATAGCVLGLGGCGTATKIDAGQVRLDYQSSVADYRKCLAAFPNNPKACEAKRLIVETNERHIQQHDWQSGQRSNNGAKEQLTRQRWRTSGPATRALSKVRWRDRESHWWHWI